MKKNSKINVIIMMTISFSLLFFPLLFISPKGVSAAEKVFNWKFSSPVTPGTRGGAGACLWYAEQFEKRTSGQIKVKIYWSNELNGPREMMMAGQSRLAEVVLHIPSYTPGETPMWNVTWLPFIAPPRTDQSTMVFNRLAKECNPLINELDKFNLIYGGVYDNEGYNFIGKKPVRNIADLKGVRIRIPPDAGEIIKQFGAVPMTVPTGEMYSALDTGLVDLVAQGVNAFHAYKLDEISKYMIPDINVSGGATLLLINKDAWNELPDNLKKALQSVIDDLPAFMWDYTHQPERLAELNDVIKQKGIEVISFPKSERDKLIAKAEPVWEAWAKRTGNYAVAKQALADYIRIRDEVVAKYPQGVPGIKNR
jgi:TRAP-type C4-dicarboxylate transport system substrate-binding protein